MLAKRKRLMLRYGTLGAVITLGATIVVLRLRGPAEAYKPGEDVEGVTSTLARDVPDDYPRVTFEDVTEGAGLAEFHHFGGERSTQLPEDMGSGAAWGDYDGDGYPDLFLGNIEGPLTGKGGGATNRLYRNRRDGTFEDVTERSGLGAAMVTTASTGNAAAALAAVAASVGQPATILVPSAAPEAKIAQLLAYGATVLLVDGSYDDAFELSMRAAERFGWYVRNTGVNPYMGEGKKTAALEIAEQMGWRAPDVVVVAVGDGCIIGGLHRGFRDLVELGWIEAVPRLIGVQAAGSDYLAQAWERDEDVVTKPAIRASTVADSIGAGLPRDRIKAMRAVRDSGGAFVRVPDDDILAAIPALAAGCGVFAEPAAAAALAGLEAAVADGLVARDERVVVLSTGTGLKDVPAAMRAVEAAGGGPLAVSPDLDAVARALAERTTADTGSAR